MARVTSDGDPDQVGVADNAIGRIELDPAAGRQINARPGVGMAGSQDALRRAAGRRAVDISRHEPRRQAETSHSLDHQNREIPAAAATQSEGRQGRLRAALQAALILEVRMNGLGHLGEEDLKARRSAGASKSTRPPLEGAIGVGVVALHGAEKIRHILGAVGEGNCAGVGSDIAVDVREGGQRRVIKPHLALEGEFIGPGAESGDTDAVAEHIVHVPELLRVWRYGHLRR